MERIVIFGSTGMTGICAVEAAVQKGLNVRAFVRDPSKLSDNLRNSVEVVKGDVLNYTDVHNAIKNVTAVVIVLGTRNDVRPTTVLSEGTKNIVKAMKDLNVNIVSISLSCFLLNPDRVPPIFKEIHAEHERQFNIIKESGLQYIIVLPPHISEQAGGQCEVKCEGSSANVVSKYDLGKFLIDCLIRPEYYTKVCRISTKY